MDSCRFFLCSGCRQKYKNSLSQKPKSKILLKIFCFLLKNFPRRVLFFVLRFIYSRHYKWKVKMIIQSKWILIISISFLTLPEVATDTTVNVRQEAMLCSGSKQEFVKCYCLKWCETRVCYWLKLNIKCNLKCHKNSSCKNK